MTKHIIKDRQIIEDHWLYTGGEEEQAIPSDEDLDIIVSFDQWQNEREKLLNRNGKLGVCIGNGVSIDDIKDELGNFDLIAILFTAFKDGRGYSYARLLRERHGFKKEIRAIGNVLRDQLFYMERCGFDAFDLEHGNNMENALAAFKDFSVRYQPAADDAATISG